MAQKYFCLFLLSIFLVLQCVVIQSIPIKKRDTQQGGYNPNSANGYDKPSYQQNVPSQSGYVNPSSVQGPPQGQLYKSGSQTKYNQPQGGSNGQNQWSGPQAGSSPGNQQTGRQVNQGSGNQGYQSPPASSFSNGPQPVQNVVIPPAGGNQGFPSGPASNSGPLPSGIQRSSNLPFAPIGNDQGNVQSNLYPTPAPSYAVPQQPAGQSGPGPVGPNEPVGANAPIAPNDTPSTTTTNTGSNIAAPLQSGHGQQGPPPQSSGSDASPINPSFGAGNNQSGQPQQSPTGQPQQPLGGQPQQPSGGQPQQPLGGQPQQPLGGQPQQPLGGQPQQPLGGQPQQPSAGQPPQQECRNIDTDAQCADWASKEQCKSNADWMMTNCYKACTNCTLQGVPGQPQPANNGVPDQPQPANNDNKQGYQYNNDPYNHDKDGGPQEGLTGNGYDQRQNLQVGAGGGTGNLGVGTNTGNGKKPVVAGGKQTHPMPAADTSSSGHFMAYFITAIVMVVIGYVAYHNKKKIMAYMVEGRQGNKSRRGSGNSGEYKSVSTMNGDNAPLLTPEGEEKFIY